MLYTYEWKFFKIESLCIKLDGVSNYEVKILWPMEQINRKI